jgi:hypothetical protein
MMAAPPLFGDDDGGLGGGGGMYSNAPRTWLPASQTLADKGEVLLTPAMSLKGPKVGLYSC